MNIQLIRSLRLLLAACCALLLLASSGAVSQAQSGELCFAEAPYCISGRIRQFWEANGGLTVFGLPITSATVRVDRTTGSTSFVQWFERHRLELYPNRPAPYDVVLGRLGAERLEQQGVVWQELERSSAPQEGCLWFPQTGANVCNQEGDAGLRAYWESQGIRNPVLTPFEQSLALWGLPLSEAYWETTDDGRRVLVQWFERARLEWHPDNPPAFRVLAGRLGAEVFGSLPSAVTVGRFTGVWEGITSQWQRVTLAVQHGQIQAVLVNVLIDGEIAATGERCSKVALFTRSAINGEPGLAPIGDGGFFLAAEDEEGVLALEGFFGSDVNATGTVRLTTLARRPFDCVGSGTAEWRADLTQQPLPGAAPAPPPPPPPPGPPVLPPGSTEEEEEAARQPTPTP